MVTIFNRFQKITGNRSFCIRFWSVILICTMFTTEMKAQYMEITVNVSPPYTSKIYDYISKPNKIMAYFTNRTGVNKNFYVLGSFTGAGIKIFTDPNYKMPTPMFLKNGESKFMTKMNIEEAFDEDHLIFVGITKNELLYGSGLPEGDYTLCLEAHEYSNGTLLSQPGMGCSAPFKVSNVEPPVIFQPVCGQQVNPSMPQALIFSWSMPPGAPANTQYNLKIIEVLPSDRNINDAVNSATHPVFFEKTVTIVTLLLGASDPSLVAGSTYAFVVTAIDPGNKVTFRNHGMSEVCSFIYSATNTPPPDPTTSGCQDNNKTPNITNTTASAKAPADFVNKVVTLGKFKMKILSANGSSSALSGTGSVVVNWLHTPVAVEFDGIKINTADQVYEGFVLAQKEDNPPVQFPFQWYLNSGPGSFNWVPRHAKLMDQWIHNKLEKFHLAEPKLIKSLDLSQRFDMPLKLPLGLNNNDEFTIAITEMKFEPKQAMLNCVAIFPLPDEGDSLGFKASSIIFSPGMPSVQTGKLGLIDDIKFRGNAVWNTYWVVFKKEQGASGGTYITWDCNGFKELCLEMDVFFPRAWLKPAPDNETDSVKTTIKTTISDWNDWLVQATLPKATITGTQGMMIEAQNIWYDHSDKRNPAGIRFPSNFKSDSSITFRGFWMQTAKLVLPDNFTTYSNPAQNITVDFNNLIINKKGITGRIIGKNIINFPDANISSLGASIDTIRFTMVCSSLDTAYISGKIVLPVSESSPVNALNYKALFVDGNGFQFTMKPKDAITAKFFSDAKLKLLPTSCINLTINKTARFDMRLNGDFTWSNIRILKIRNITMGMKFQNLGLSYDEETNQMVFDKGTWSFASDEKKLGGFPVSIENIKSKKLANKGDEILRGGLDFDLVVNLDKDKIGGRCSFETIGTIKRSPKKKFVPGFDTVSISQIKVFSNFSAVKLDGMVEFYSDDPMYGNGFHGTVKATFNSIQAEVDASLRFGSTNFSVNPVHNYDTSRADNLYRYWYADAKVIVPPTAGIPFLTGFAFYGFGAGVWRHMMVEPAKMPSIAITDKPMRSTISGTPFIPSRSAGLGFMAKAVMGTYPSPKAINADVTLQATFDTTSDGLLQIGFKGGLWAMTELTARDQSPVFGSVSIDYDLPTQHFRTNARVTIDKPPLKGQVDLLLDINGKTKKWYFLFGTPNNLNTVTVFNKFEVNNYLMVGNDFGSFTSDYHFMKQTRDGLKSVGINADQLKVVVSNDDNAKYGKGFSFGLGLFAGTGEKDKMIIPPRVFFRYNIGGGFEINLSVLKYPPNILCPEGYKGWYTTGNVAAWFKAGIGIHVVPSDKFICFPCCVKKNPNGCDLTLADIKIGGYLSAGFPNPTWAEGEIKGEYHLFNGWISGDFHASFYTGDKCAPSPPADDGTYVQEDAIKTLQNLIILVNPEDKTTGFDPGRTIGVSYNLTPDVTFDIEEMQSNGTIKSRTFQAKYFATLDNLGPVYPPGVVPAANQNPGFPKGVLGSGTAFNTNPVLTATIKNQQTLPQGKSPNVVQPKLVRSPDANAMGEYSYWLEFYSQTGVTTESRSFADTTRYKLNLTAQLWELKNGVWGKAKDENSKEITESRSVAFETSKLIAKKIPVSQTKPGSSPSKYLTIP
ncbi:MAG: hypothetical protein NTX61_08810 [Bacteroidetes bacterium]|nr:hypothetical protein [Bacteroidota bacterium]